MKRHIPGIIILLCAVIVIIWQVAGLLASRPGDDFALKAEDFESFELKLEGWNVEQLEVDSNFMEVNLLKYRVGGRGQRAEGKRGGGELRDCGIARLGEKGTEVGGRKSEDRGRKSEDRGRRSDDGDQRSEQLRMLNAEAANLTTEQLNNITTSPNDSTTQQFILQTATLSDGPNKNSNVSGLESRVYGLRSSAPQVLIRLVHGYNMRDCMRIKGYAVQEISKKTLDHRPETIDREDGPSTPEGFAAVSAPPLREGREVKTADEPAESTNEQINNLSNVSGLESMVYGLWSSPAQLWRLTSSSGDGSLWMSGIVRAGDFSPMDLSVTDMPFPRVGTPDDPNWIPRGLTWKSLRHPIRNFKYFLRAKWNAARCDLLTFLGLRKPVWASDDALTLLVIRDISTEENEEEVETLMQDIYCEVLDQLREWGAQAEPARL